MTVEPPKAAAKIDHDGQSYYFCSTGCALRFAQAPENSWLHDRFAKAHQLSPSHPITGRGKRVAEPKIPATAPVAAPSAAAMRVDVRAQPPHQQLRVAAAPKASATPARCIRKSCRSAQAPAPSAAWRSSRWIRSPKSKPIPNTIPCASDSGSAPRSPCPLLVLVHARRIPRPASDSNASQLD